jgi:hypothetical protein
LFLALKGSGPLVTVGRPDEIEPLLGASRIYFYDDQWQAGVEYLMMISSLVVFQADFSEGVSWELGAAKRLLNPKQLVISFLSWSSIDSATRQSMYERIQKQLEERFETSLPAKLGDATFMVFEQDWTPRLVEISKWKRFFFIASAITMIRETLRRHLSARNLALAWVRTALYYLFVAVLVSFPFLAIYLVRSFKSFDIGPNAVFIIFGMLVWAILLLAWCLWGGYVFFIKSLYDRIGNTPSQVIE